MKLQNLIEVVLEGETTDKTMEITERICLDFPTRGLRRHYNHAKFQSMELTLGMFIPTDDKGKVLESPNESNYFYENHNEQNGQTENRMDYVAYMAEVEAYNQAKAKVLFEGFEAHDSIDLDKIYLEHIDSTVICGLLRGLFWIDNLSISITHIHNLCDLGLELTDYAVETYKL